MARCRVSHIPSSKQSSIHWLSSLTLTGVIRGVEVCDYALAIPECRNNLDPVQNRSDSATLHADRDRINPVRSVKTQVVALYKVNKPKLKLNQSSEPTTARSGMGVIKPIFSVPYFPVFSHCQNNSLLLNITVIFHRCRRSWAVVTPVKYESDSINLIGIFFSKSKVSLTEESRNGDLVTPTPGQVVGADTTIAADQRWFNSLTPGRRGFNFEWITLNTF